MQAGERREGGGKVFKDVTQHAYGLLRSYKLGNGLGDAADALDEDVPLLRGDESFSSWRCGDLAFNDSRSLRDGGSSGALLNRGGTRILRRRKQTEACSYSRHT